MAPATADRDTVTVALLRDLLTEIRGLRADWARDRRPSSLTRQDWDRLARILPAVGGVCGSTLFTARELVEHDSAALRLVLAGVNARQLGRLLAADLRVRTATQIRSSIPLGRLV